MTRSRKFCPFHASFIDFVRCSAQNSALNTTQSEGAPCNVVEGAALLLSDLGVTRAVSSAAWFPRELAKPRSATARSVSLCAPPFASWKWPSPPFRSRPPSVPLEYRGSNARYDQSQCFIITTTRHSLTLPTGNPRSFYPRSLELTKNKNADRREHDETFVLYFGALTVRRTR